MKKKPNTWQGIDISAVQKVICRMIWLIEEINQYHIPWDKSFCNVKSLTLVKREIIMGAVQIREELYHYIEEADAKLLKMLYAVAKEYTQDDYTLPGEPMSKEILKSRIRAAKSRIKAGQFTTQEDLEKEMKEW